MPWAERSPGFLWWAAGGLPMWPEHERHRAPVGDFPPVWASAWGDDPYGLWAELTVNKVTQRMRWIEPGRFMMGSRLEEGQSVANELERESSLREAPQHEVTISSGFWLADTPCTQALWAAVMDGGNPSHFTQMEEPGQYPVESVTWDDARLFVLALGTLVAGQAALPTEAQWEYACRADTRTAYWWGDTADPTMANVASSAGENTTPVQRYAANPWGLYDMIGNVWEWCLDYLRPYRDQAETDPTGGTEGTEGDTRVLRGGAWSYRAAWARSAYRFHAPADYRYRAVGFRFLLSSPAQPGPGGPGGLSVLGET